MSEPKYTFTCRGFENMSKEMQEVILKMVELAAEKIESDNLKESEPPFEGIADRHYIFGVWSDKEKNLYVAVYGAGKVKKVEADGNVKTVYVSPSDWSPCGGLTSTDGIMWIMEFSYKNTTRVRKISKDGKHTLYGG